MNKNNKKKYPRFHINRLKKHGLYSSLRNFFVYTDPDFEEEESDSLEENTGLSEFDKNEIIEKMDIWYIS
jgi:hypothetical protein